MPDYLVLDIETTPVDFEDRAVIDYLIRKKSDRSYHPFFAKVIAIGIKRQKEDPIVWAGADEKAILDDFWEYIADNRPGLYVTFNGMGFDLPFLSVRSMINGVRPTDNVNVNKWRMMEGNHFDIMVALTDKWGITWVAFDITCKVMGIDLPEDAVRGYQIPDLHAREDWDTIRRHNLQDLELTEKLFQRIFEYF